VCALEFGKAVCATADEVLKQHGLAGYKERWAEHDFPVAELDLLKSYILRWERNRWPSQAANLARCLAG
jgi:predicted flap endonuclease-1-like 5' DNA nuclease